jgi:hypothetical protein
MKALAAATGARLERLRVLVHHQRLRALAVHLRAVAAA